MYTRTLKFTLTVLHMYGQIYQHLISYIRINIPTCTKNNCLQICTGVRVHTNELVIGKI